MGHQALCVTNGNYNECHVGLIPCKMVTFSSVTTSYRNHRFIREIKAEEEAVMRQNCRHLLKRYQSDVNRHIEQFPKRTSRFSVPVSSDKQKFEVEVTY